MIMTVDDVHAVAVMADNLLSHGVGSFRAILDRMTGRYLVSWEIDDEELYNLERDKQPDGRDNHYRAAGDHTAYVAQLGVGHVLDTHVVGTGSAMRSAVICFYLSNEGVSLLENASHLGLPVPEKLKEVLSQLHNKHEKDGTNTAVTNKPE